MRGSWSDVTRTTLGVTIGVCLGVAIQARSAPPAARQPADMEAGTLRVQRIELVDANGKERGVMAARPDGAAYLTLSNPEKKTSASLGVGHDQGPRLLLLEGDTGAATIEVQDGGKPVLTLQPTAGRPRSLRP